MASADGGAAAATSQVVWVQNKQGNTGKGGGLAELLGHIWRGRDRPGDAEGILVQRPSSAEALRKYAADKGWVEFPCPLSNFLLGAKDKIVVRLLAWYFVFLSHRVGDTATCSDHLTADASFLRYGQRRWMRLRSTAGRTTWWRPI